MRFEFSKAAERNALPDACFVPPAVVCAADPDGFLAEYAQVALGVESRHATVAF